MRLKKSRLIEIIKEEIDQSLMPQPLSKTAKYDAKKWTQGPKGPLEKPNTQQDSESGEDLAPVDLDPIESLRAEYQKIHTAVPTDKELLKFAAERIQKLKRASNPLPKPPRSSEETEVGGTEYLKKVGGLFKK